MLIADDTAFPCGFSGPGHAIAHLGKDGRTHALRDHLETVAAILHDDLAPLGFGDIGHLLGLSHDVGKATQEWQDAIGTIHNDAQTGRRPAQ